MVATAHPTPPSTTSPDIEQVAEAVLCVGTILLEGGCETKLVEDTMDSVGTSFPGVCSCTANVVLTGITLGVSTTSTTVTRIARIDSVGHNLWAIGKVMELAERCRHEHLGPPYVLSQLEAVRRGPHHSALTLTVASAAGAVGFAIFYGASGATLLFVALAAAAVMWTGRLLSALLPSPSLGILGQAFVAALAYALFHRAFPGVNLDTMLTSVLMLLVPGMTLTTAILDILSGNYLASGARLMTVLLVGVAIAIGASVALNYTGILTWQPS